MITVKGIAEMITVKGIAEIETSPSQDTCEFKRTEIDHI